MTHLTTKTAVRDARAFAVHRSLLEDFTADESAFDCTITDPPYDKRTQDNTRRGRQTKKAISEAMPLGFDPATVERRARWAQRIAHVTRRWAAVFSDHEGSMDWANALERAGMIYIRCAIWVRTGDLEIGPEKPTHSGAPQFTGDRPAAGHEVIVLAHSRGVRMRWNGKGKSGVYTSPVVRGDIRIHPAQKPLTLMTDIVRDFCSPGENVFDPFCGSGTTLVACKGLGVGCVGLDRDPKFAAYAARRAAAAAGPTTTKAEAR